MIGHPLGIDIHEEEPIYGRSFAPSMMVTMEPGLYLPLENTKIPEKWRGIAVRIEDDILITQTGPDVLTKQTPKELNEIEELMKHKTEFSAHVGQYHRV